MDALELAAGNAQPARRRARGQKEAVVGQRLVALQRELTPSRIETHDVLAAAQLDPVLLVERSFVHVGLLAIGLAAQVLLGQRRALVRTLRLGTQQHETAVVALLAQGLGCFCTGEAGADDNERLLVSGHGRPHG